MADSVSLGGALIFLCVFCSLCALGGGCDRQAPVPSPLVAQLSGTLVVRGLSAPVRVVRDRWGVPHVYAQNQDDLFFAQGFVQAEDRLFQMDLWRRAVQGRLAEVLGPNFVERDAMTRRVQYRGDMNAEWASYGPDAKAIATAFVHGINAWVALARERPPEEFVLAGWTPDFWLPVDLLNRTDAFVSSGDAIDEVRRRQLSDVVADAIRRVGTAPFFTALAAPPVRLKADATNGDVRGVRLQPDRGLQPDHPNAGGHLSASDHQVSLSESPHTFQAPSPRHFVHLVAPGWNVIGATAPWLPGVAIGHNERIAWGMAAIEADTQDVYVDPVEAAATTPVAETIRVKGRRSPLPFERALTPHGVVVASDRERRLVFTVRWSGFEAGAAAGLAALAVDRARTWPEFRAGLARWKMPARRFVYADSDGNVGFQDAALVPIRRSGEWRGWLTIDDLPHAFNPRGGTIDVQEPTPDRPSADRSIADREIVFAHVLAVSGASRQRFNIGPLARPSGDDSPVRATFDTRNWDRSLAINAPGQSASPGTPHADDLAKRWAAGEYFPLPFSAGAVGANAETTLMLVSESSHAPRP